MPIYLYECTKCSQKGEYLVSEIGGSPLRCASCDATGEVFKRAYDGQTFAAVSSGSGIGHESFGPDLVLKIEQGFCKVHGPGLKVTITDSNGSIGNSNN